MNNITINDKYEVLTPTGWSNFNGVKKTLSNKKITVFLENGMILNCTKNHKIKTKTGFVFAENITVDNFISTTNGYVKVKSIEKKMGYFNSYDLLEVENKNEYYTNDIVSHNCEFMGSSGTLISTNKLKVLSESIPIYKANNISQYEQPKPNHIYALIGDVSKGRGLDYSTFSIIDVTDMPYKQVCTFRDNLTTPLDYASLVYQFGTLYNEAFVLIEINNIGDQVSDALLLDYGYENMIFTQNAGRKGKTISSGFSKNVDKGINTTHGVKITGCNVLKMMVEQDQLLIPDFDTIQELKRFSRKGNSYEAEPGSNDDMVMTLVLFSWLASQRYFSELTDINTLSKLRERKDEDMEAELPFFGYVNDGSLFEHEIEYTSVPEF